MAKKKTYLEEIKCLDLGYVRLLNIGGPIRRVEQEVDASDVDPANAARISFDGHDEEERTEEQDHKLARYLLKNGHTSPWEMIEVWMEMKMPIFCARQFVRHRTASLNEMSARYTEMPDDFYIPDPANVGIQSKDNKQARDIGGDVTQSDADRAKLFCDDLADHSKASYNIYQKHINNGVPRELARCFLGVNIYTKWIWKQNLHNLMHLMSLRCHSHAQHEAQVFGNAIYELLKPRLPNCMDAFDKFRRKND